MFFHNMKNCFICFHKLNMLISYSFISFHICVSHVFTIKILLFHMFSQSEYIKSYSFTSFHIPKRSWTKVLATGLLRSATTEVGEVLVDWTNLTRVPGAIPKALHVEWSLGMSEAPGPTPNPSCRGEAADFTTCLTKNGTNCRPTRTQASCGSFGLLASKSNRSTHTETFDRNFWRWCWYELLSFLRISTFASSVDPKSRDNENFLSMYLIIFNRKPLLATMQRDGPNLRSNDGNKTWVTADDRCFAKAGKMGSSSSSLRVRLRPELKWLLLDTTQQQQ